MNEQALAVRESAALPVKTMEDVFNLGKVFETSGMFGCNKPGQGAVLALTCLSENISPMSFMRKYHLVEGKPSMRADAMLAEFCKYGSYQILSRTPEKAAIRMKLKDGDAQEFSFTWEEAAAEPFTKDKNNNLKHNWATPRARMQMLWARVVSDAVRCMAPWVNAGTYTPEEAEDFTTAPAVRNVTPAPANEEAMHQAVREIIEEVPATVKVASAPAATTSTTTTPAASGAAETFPTPAVADTPVTVVQAEVVQPEDPTVSPIGRNRGKKWAELDDKILDLALKSGRPEISQKHIEAIKAEQAKRAEAAKAVAK
jgi:hypothetical protein